MIVLDTSGCMAGEHDPAAWCIPLRTKGVVVLGNGLDAPRVQHRKLAQRAGARRLQPLRQQPPNARQLPCLRTSRGRC